MPKSLSQTSQQELHRHKYLVFASADYSSGPQLYKDTRAVLPHTYIQVFPPQKSTGGHNAGTKSRSPQNIHSK